jgi:hypothetical protein
VILLSGAFAGIYGGWWAQEYWYYNDLEVYYDVNPLNASLAMKQDGNLTSIFVYDTIR